MLPAAAPHSLSSSSVLAVPPIPVLGIPFYNRLDLLRRCLASIDHPVDRLVLINNSGFPLPGCWTARSATHTHRIEHPNAGVAASWNEIIKLFPAPWWLIANNDIEFAPGDLAKMAAEVAADPQTGMFYGNHGASWFGITAEAVERVGLFDENFYPAYLEDCDWHWRAVCAAMPMVNVPGCAAIHGDGKLTGSCTVNLNAELAAQNNRTHGGNFDYYVNKWGGVNGKEKHREPFGLAGLPVWAFPFHPARRAAQQWNAL